MAEVLNVHPPNWPILCRSSLSTRRSSLSHLLSSPNAINRNPSLKWKTLREELKCQGRYSCFFADGNKQEQARKALESALGGKKTEFEKWNKEIQKREEMGGGGGSVGRGGWFGGGGWFGWFGGEHFWEEAQQASLALIGIISLYLLLVKGNRMFAVISNSLLFLLRGIRSWLTFLSESLQGRTSLPASGNVQMAEANQPKLSAKERVIRKWGMD